MKRIRFSMLLILSSSLTLALPTPSWAWGPDGHRIVGVVAAEYLSDSARTAINDLLDGDTLASVANWADNVRNFRPQTKPWHYVDIPVGTNSAYKESRDCQNGDCVIGAIEAQKAILADTSKPKKERVEALKYIVHFIGDMHQPLHCADKGDSGGNGLIVKFFGKKSKLHAVWDSGIIRQAGLIDSEFADALLGELEKKTPGEIGSMQDGTLVDWANETHKLAKSNAYFRVRQNSVLSEAYYNRNWKVVDDQLTKAGLRLAKILNTVFQ